MSRCPGGRIFLAAPAAPPSWPAPEETMNETIAAVRPGARRTLSVAGAAALSAALTVALPQRARADEVTPLHVPPNIEVPAGHRAFLLGHATGTQNYVCLPSGFRLAWTLFTPQATLFDRELRQITTHFFGPNPFENEAIRAVWQHSQDTSTVWGQAIASSSDPAFVAPGAIPWLLVRVVGAQDGPGPEPRPGVLTPTTFIQRVRTVGGSAPLAGCSRLQDVGNKAFVPYKADYVFYAAEASY
jgi:hypothetical protein